MRKATYKGHRDELYENPQLLYAVEKVLQNLGRHFAPYAN